MSEKHLPGILGGCGLQNGLFFIEKKKKKRPRLFWLRFSYPLHKNLDALVPKPPRLQACEGIFGVGFLEIGCNLLCIFSQNCTHILLF